MPELPVPLRPLAQYPQFIIWKSEWDAGKNKHTKKPINPGTRFPTNPHDPANWMDASTATGLAQLFGEGYGYGFVFTDNDPFWFLDIDNCVESGAWTPLAQRMLDDFPGAAAEVSLSGYGLHIFGSGPVPDHGCKNMPHGLELYHTGRFVALTGDQATGCASTDHSAALARVVSEFFPPSARVTAADWTDGPADDWDGPADDETLIKKMLDSRGGAGSVFGGRATVRDLWTRNEEKLAATYPDNFGERSFDHSNADAALCQYLAFWTGRDCGRIDRMFRQSALYRDKWERDDYRENTILGAVALCNASYTPRKKKPTPSYTESDSVKPDPAQAVTSRAVHREGLQFMAPSGQDEMFSGCVYVRDIHRVFTPCGALLQSEQFRAVYGGYIFALDSTNDKTTKNAWEVFTESQAVRFPRVHSTCFRPELPPGDIIEESGSVMLNSYVPIDTPRKPGDASPFTDHLALLLPNGQDQAILMAYMAAIVQHPGVKFQWAPLIQGCEGNGKTLLIKCVEAAVGQKYTHFPNASDLGGNGSKFNAWIQNKLFIGVEEVYVSDRREVSDALKPLITNDRIEIQGKGADQVTGDNRANFMMCSNHKDAILKNRGDRRYAVFFTAQQTPEDMQAAGMCRADGTTPTEYFSNLWRWLKSDGFAIVTNYLQNYEIPAQLNPADLCSRAPITSSTAEAIASSMGGIEQEILEKIEQNAPGFAGGWVSSLALDRLLRERRDDKRITHNRRGELLQGMGYAPHPGLRGGRSGRVVPFDGGRPRLYVKPGSIQSGITGATVIIDAYVKSQGDASALVAEIFNQQEKK